MSMLAKWPDSDRLVLSGCCHDCCELHRVKLEPSGPLPFPVQMPDYTLFALACCTCGEFQDIDKLQQPSTTPEATNDDTGTA